MRWFYKALLLLGSFTSVLCVPQYGQELHQRTQYVLQPGDVLETAYQLTPEFNQTITIHPDGFINLDIVGPVHVAGMTLEEAHDAIVKGASLHLNHPELNLNLKQFEQPYVVVAGEVFKPGKIELHQSTTALQAILLAGGTKESAYDSHVYLFRKINGDNAEVKMLDLSRVKKSGDLEHDIQLQPGDMLLIPRNKLDKLAHFMHATSLGLYFSPTDLIR